jgi:hypothetical protein
MAVCHMIEPNCDPGLDEESSAPKIAVT